MRGKPKFYKDMGFTLKASSPSLKLEPKYHYDDFSVREPWCVLGTSRFAV
jgi:hypothetical protein